ncbi:MAG: acyltransferase [[Eubacterium] sulci]|jgi:acyltransferase 3|nr:acyltransferase [[Eubacterium] sulci]MBF1137597.1 acyltransferase [[Eubacterium] sulci]MBF1138552.1 acyltransferase [[Eubacterium] sulci]MBF1150985.1 acyltransferase [[Eubacterium] sulci]MBF1154538.1 acyltransferase [[Eubacterium] sulci]
MEKREHLAILDIIKICCAVLIYMRHSITMFGCTYGSSLVDGLICATTSPIMVCFFVVSGFSIYYNNSNRNLLDAGELRTFYKKRFITLFPIYILVHMLSYVLVVNTVQQKIYSTPVELLGLQSMYGGLFGISHSGATWFISSLLLGYFIYPLVQELLKMNQRCIYLVTSVIFFVLVYSEVVMLQIFGVQPGYVNPVFRAMQVAFGAALCMAFTEDDKGNNKKAAIMMVANLIITGLLTAFALHYKMGIEYVTTPIYYYLIAFAMLISIKFKPRLLTKSKLIKYAGSLTFYFFILQVFLWRLSAKVCGLTGFESNKGKLLVSFVLCVALSIICKELFDKHAQKYLKNKLLKK